MMISPIVYGLAIKRLSLTWSRIKFDTCLGVQGFLCLCYVWQWFFLTLSVWGHVLTRLRVNQKPLLMLCMLYFFCVMLFCFVLSDCVKVVWFSSYGPGFSGRIGYDHPQCFQIPANSQVPAFLEPLAWNCVKAQGASDMSRVFRGALDMTAHNVFKFPQILKSQHFSSL